MIIYVSFYLVNTQPRHYCGRSNDRIWRWQSFSNGGLLLPTQLGAPIRATLSMPPPSRLNSPSLLSSVLLWFTLNPLCPLYTASIPFSIISLSLSLSYHPLSSLLPVFFQPLPRLLFFLSWFPRSFLASLAFLSSFSLFLQFFSVCILHLCVSLYALFLLFLFFFCIIDNFILEDV